MISLSEEILYDVIRPRPKISHKGTFGRVLLVGGNSHYGGAIIMSAQAAVYSGAGLVTVATDQKNHSPLHSRLPEAMVIDWQDKAAVQAALETADVVLLGPGLGLEEHSRELLVRVFEAQAAEQWLIIDGSAITLFAEKPLPMPAPEKIIFTPHQKEWERLSGLPPAVQNPDVNQQAQQQLGASVVVKSSQTEIHTPQNSYTIPVGSPAMATGGMGDTLAGILCSFIAQFKKKEEALCAAVYLHSLIGEELGKTQYVVLPSQITDALPTYMKRFEAKKQT